MEATLTNSIHNTVKRWLFGLSFLLLCMGILGYSYWKSHQIVALSAPSTPEQIYYSKLVYAVNEMHNQVEQYDSLVREGKLSLTQMEKEEAYVNSLMLALTAPPEELSVSQAITDDLFNSYHQYLHNLAAGSPLLASSSELMKHHYELFRQNADIITVLSAYNGVNVDCH